MVVDLNESVTGTSIPTFDFGMFPKAFPIQYFLLTFLLYSYLVQDPAISPCICKPYAKYIKTGVPTPMAQADFMDKKPLI